MFYIWVYRPVIYTPLENFQVFKRHSVMILQKSW
jgi:hypothetical protein